MYPCKINKNLQHNYYKNSNRFFSALTNGRPTYHMQRADMAKKLETVNKMHL